MPPDDILKAVLLFGAAALIFRWNLWRAVLFVQPASMRLEPDAPADQATPPPSLQPREAELLALGFVRLGSHLERPRLSRARVSYDYAHPVERAFATLFASPRDEARLFFLTPTANGGFVITADHRRPAHEQPGRYVSGGMEETPADRVFKAHQRRVPTVGEPQVVPTLEARLEAGRAWYLGAGQREVRQQNALGLLWTLGTLGMVGILVFTMWR